MKSFLVLLLVAGPAHGRLPPDAQALLNQIPGGKLSLPYVVGRGMATTESYRAIHAQRLAADAPELRTLALLDTRLTAKVGYQDDRREPSIPFMPNRTRGTLYSLGVSKFFSTGTALEAELAHGLNRIGFETIPPNEYAETKLTLGLRQSLWKDAFGGATRAALEAGEHLTEVNRAAYREARNDWFLQLAELYYGSWLAQAQAAAAMESLARRERLLKTTRLKVSRGTAERPDLLQVQAARAVAEIQLSQARQNLGDRWRLLVTTLKLPPQIAAVDPGDIPLGLDDPEQEMLSLCGAEEGRRPPDKASPAVERARAAREAAQAQLDRARSEKNPSLDLGVNVGSNSIAPNSGDTVEDFGRFRYPLVGASLTLSFPLGFDQAEADLKTAAADLMKAEAAASQAEDTWKVSWRNGCLELRRLTWSRKMLKEALDNQRERERLEEGRFRLGRGTTLQVIQAGDDVTLAEQSLWNVETQVRLQAWRLAALNGASEKFLDSLESKASGSAQ